MIVEAAVEAGRGRSLARPGHVQPSSAKQRCWAPAPWASRIAAHLANAGLPVVLLDLPAEGARAARSRRRRWMP